MNMKKFFVIIAILFASTAIVLAEEGEGSCKINGTANDYVNVTAYTDGDGKGNFVIANSSSKPLMSLKIEIIATDINGKEVTIYNKNYNAKKVEPYQSHNVEFTYPKLYNSKVKNITVKISNATCVNN